MFKRHIRKKNQICDFLTLREELEKFGLARFYWDMENLKIFKDGYLNIENNPFALLICKNVEKEMNVNFEKAVILLKNQNEIVKNQNELIKVTDFIFLTSKEHEKHKLIIPKTLECDCFNVLTLNKKHIPMLEKMKEIALAYVMKEKYSSYFLCFHCYPFNSVNALHLHIINPDIETSFMEKANNVCIDTVLDYLKIL